MKRLIPIAVLALAAPAVAQPAPDAAQRPQRAYANPSALVAADIALARLARKKGPQAALRETADDVAELLDGKRVLAKAALTDRMVTGAPMNWAPHSAWISCDGTAGVTFGGWQGAAPQTGEYVTVWQRQFKGKIDWKWLLDLRQPLATPLRDVDWAEGKVADCPVRTRPDGETAQPGSKRERKENSKLPPLRPLAGTVPAADAAAGADSKDGQSRDGSLAWRSVVMPDGARLFTAWIWKDGRMVEVIARNFSAKGA